MLKNDLIIKAAKGQLVERIPVWLMRQAGRILPEYRELRNKFKDFKEYIKNPEAAAIATLQPVKSLEVDAAIIFSDILVIPEAMGLNYEMIEKKGPWFPNKIETEQDIHKLKVSNATEDLQYVLKAIKIVKEELNHSIPLIGFAGAPWTIFAYMIEGSGSKTFSNARRWLYTNPALSHALLQKITLSTIDYLKCQIAAGADVIQIFDSWAGILGPTQYKEFALKYISDICDSIKQAYPDIPIIVFAKDAYFARKEMQLLNCDVVGLDWCMDVLESRSIIPNKTLQGNLDPCALYSSNDNLKKETVNMLTQFGMQKYIANLGHGLYPDVEVDKVKIFIDTVKNFRG